MVAATFLSTDTVGTKSASTIMSSHTLSLGLFRSSAALIIALFVSLCTQSLYLSSSHPILSPSRSATTPTGMQTASSSGFSSAGVAMTTLQLNATSIDVFESKTARCTNGTLSYNPAVDSSGDIDQGYGPRRELLFESLAVSADGNLVHELEYSSGGDDGCVNGDDDDRPHWLLVHYGEEKVQQMLEYMQNPGKNWMLISLARNLMSSSQTFVA